MDDQETASNIWLSRAGGSADGWVGEAYGKAAHAFVRSLPLFNEVSDRARAAPYPLPRVLEAFRIHNCDELASNSRTFLKRQETAKGAILERRARVRAVRGAKLTTDANGTGQFELSHVGGCSWIPCTQHARRHSHVFSAGVAIAARSVSTLIGIVLDDHVGK